MRIKVFLFAVGLLAALVRLAAADVVYVTSFDNDSVLKFDAENGASLGRFFVPSGSGGINGPTGLTFWSGRTPLCLQLRLQLFGPEI